jgi:predicted AAA+ superfamily ATPase
MDLPGLLREKSHFLFGPRSTGKTSLIDAQLTGKAVCINLLRTNIQTRLIVNPSELESMIDVLAKDVAFPWVVIDEIQKIPALLDEVHRLIEERKLRFLLSGSSARRLKAQGVNLLGGRAWMAHMFPLNFSELPSFDLDRMLRFGGLPHVVTSDSPERELEAYVATYINEEIKIEGLVRKIPAFLGFLRAAALSNAQLINFSQIGSDAGVSATTIREYYSILEDTLIGKLVEPWGFSKKRKAIATGKFYFFDTGVCHTLAQTEHVDRNSDLYGRSFEHWIYMELASYLSYRKRREKLCFWRSQDQKEVDFVIGNRVAVEAKACSRVSGSDLSGLRALQEEGIISDFYLVSNDGVERLHEGIHHVHWKTFMRRLWDDRLVS